LRYEVAVLGVIFSPSSMLFFRSSRLALNAVPVTCVERACGIGACSGTFGERMFGARSPPVRLGMTRDGRRRSPAYVRSGLGFSSFVVGTAGALLAVGDVGEPECSSSRDGKRCSNDMRDGVFACA
jgi:hypothetical protein